MAAKKPTQFTDEFVSSITADGSPRGEALKSQRLLDVYQARQDLSAKVKEKYISTIQSLGGQELTINDILDEKSPVKEIFIDNIVVEGNTSPVKNLIGDFKNVLAEVGVKGAGTVNPFRTIIQTQVGEAKYLEAGFDTSTKRLRPISIPPEVYRITKDIAAGLLNPKNNDPDLKNAGGRMLLMMQGGYRPSDFKALSIENIDFETGIVTGLELKTDKGTKGIGVAYFPRSQLDVVRAVIGDRKSGLVFQNPEVLDKIINENLKSSELPKIRYLQESTNTIVENPFTAYDFRRMQETALQAAGYNAKNPIRKYLTWRPLSGTEASEGYMVLQNQSAALEEANARAFEPYIHLSDGNVVKLEDGKVVKTHGQFLNEVGVKKLSPYTKRYVASKAGLNALPINIQETMGPSIEGITYSDTSISDNITPPNAKSAQGYLEAAKVNNEARIAQAEINKVNKQIELLDKQQELASKPAPPPLQTSGKKKQIASRVFEDIGEVSDELKKSLASIGVNLAETVEDVTDTVVETGKKVVDAIPPKVKKALPFVAAPEGYRLAKEKASDMGLPGVLPDVVGATGAFAEVFAPVGPTDVKDAATGFAGQIKKGEEQRQIMLDKARSIRSKKLAEKNEADSVSQDQGFLSR